MYCMKTSTKPLINLSNKPILPYTNALQSWKKQEKTYIVSIPDMRIQLEICSGGCMEIQLATLGLAPPRWSAPNTGNPRLTTD